MEGVECTRHREEGRDGGSEEAQGTGRKVGMEGVRKHKAQGGR